MRADFWCGTAAMALLMMPGHAVAQAAATSAGQATPAAHSTGGSDGADSGLREIVVTAERRVQNLQDVPIAATALSGDQLDDKAVRRIGDLQFASPSLSVTDAGLTQNVNIRGIGIASGSPAVANGVATYIDGVFQPQLLTTSSFYDIMNVEVLRGPQGTLVGSNSTGGALFINSQIPILDKAGGYAQLGYGNYDDLTAQGAINVPITDTLAIRVAGNHRARKSFFNDHGPLNDKPDRLHEDSVRALIRWEPGAFRAIGKIELIDRNTGGYAYRPIPGTQFAAGRIGDIRDLNYNAPTKNFERGTLSSLELRYDFGFATLRSVTGYTNKRINNLYDTDATTLAKLTGDQYVREREWTEEVNLLSPTGGAFNWIVGGYFQRNRIDVNLFNRTNTGAPTDPTHVVSFTRKGTYGAFGQAGYKVVPAVELQLGVRYSHFESQGAGSVKIGGAPIFPAGGLQVSDLTSAHEDGRLTGKATVNWTINPDQHFYAFVARGYKPGGANSVTLQFRPETVWDYEVGLKSSFLANHLRTQLGGFYMDYHDFQFDSINPSTGLIGIINIGSAKIYGLEAQGQAKLGRFALDGGAAYVHSHLDGTNQINPRLIPSGSLGPQCATGVASNPPVCFNYLPFVRTAGDGPNLYSPKFSLNAGISYEAPLSDETTLTPRLNYGYISSRYTNLFYSPTTDLLRGRGILSALLTLRFKAWSLEGYATNLTNQKYVTGQTGNNEFYGAPREYGVRASVKF